MSSNNSNFRILVVDDEPLIRQSLYEILRIDGYKVQMAANAEDALDAMAKNKVDIVVTDLKLPKLSGIDLLQKAKEEFPEAEFIIITGYGSIESAVEAMKMGAFEYITKPINDQEIKLLIQNIIEKKVLLQENLELKEFIAKQSPSSFLGMIGASQRMQKIYNIIDSVASTNATILITGESGTGKGLVARAIHESDKNRGNKPFVEISCGALSETLLESELFGHVKGAFTGAIKDKEGRFEYAQGGTIFLDEIDTFSLNLQVKLLRVLQDGVFERVGDNITRKAEARVIVATNQDLLKLIENGEFRGDLYYRVNVINIHIPPLRERMEDLERLIEYFISKYSKNNNKKIKGISAEAMEMLKGYHWPGNIREVENALEGAVILAKGDLIQVDDVPNKEKFQTVKGAAKAVAMAGKEEEMTLKRVVEMPEKELIISVLKEYNWNRNKAAAALGVNRTTLYNKMKKYKIVDKNKGE